MPWDNSWIDPEMALNNYKDVTVYHTYRDDSIYGSVRRYVFTTDIMFEEEGEGVSFDVRESIHWPKDWAEEMGDRWNAEGHAIIDTLKAIIDAGPGYTEDPVCENFWGPIKEEGE